MLKQKVEIYKLNGIFKIVNKMWRKNKLNNERSSWLVILTNRI